MPRISELKWQRKRKNQDFFKNSCSSSSLSYVPPELLAYFI